MNPTLLAVYGLKWNPFSPELPTEAIYIPARIEEFCWRIEQVHIGMHHDQDIRNMGGLWKHMRITWVTALLGSLALIGTPLFAGFYSKDSIIEVVHASQLWGAGFANFAVLAGVFVTAFYSFRMFFLVFHGAPRFHHKPFPGEHDAHDDHHGDAHAHTPHESSWVITAPLVLLAIPSVLIGYYTISPMLFGDFFKDSIVIDGARHGAMATFAKTWQGPWAMALHAFSTAPFWLALAGVASAWFIYLKRPSIAVSARRVFGPIYTLLDNKYYLDWFNEHMLARATRALGVGLWKGGDTTLIDGAIINGSARGIGTLAAWARRVQTGQLYWYAFVMMLGVFALLTWQLWPYIQTWLGPWPAAR